MTEKINYFKFICNGREFTVDAHLDQWNDIKFDSFLYLRDSELYIILDEYVRGSELKVIGTDYNGKVYEEKVIRAFPEVVEINNVYVPHIVLFSILDYIDKVIGWGSVINVKTKKINYLSDMSEANREDVYYLGVFCRKLNCSPYYDRNIWDLGFHYYIEKK